MEHLLLRSQEVSHVMKIPFELITKLISNIIKDRKGFLRIVKSFYALWTLKPGLIFVFISSSLLICALVLNAFKL